MVTDKTTVLGLTSGTLWGLFAAALILPLSGLMLSPILLVLILAAIVLILRVAGRADAAFVGIGVLIGFLVGLLVPSLSIAAIQDGSKLLIAGVLVLLSYHV